MKTIIHIVGARPNFIKAAPLIKSISDLKVRNLVVHTGQHYDHNMSQQFFDDLEIPKPDYNLGLGGGSHAVQTANIMMQCEQVFIKESPDCVIVYGDVNSCIAAALVAKKLHIQVVHIESGLRSFDTKMPEEINRIITDSISDQLFVTCKDGVDNLIKEGKSIDCIHLVGNTMIDSLVKFQSKFDTSSILSSMNIQSKKYILSTLHRPSNVDNKNSLIELMESMKAISNNNIVVFPIHPRTKSNLQKFNIFKKYNSIDSLKIIDPLGYIDFMCLQKNAKLIITDSGGIQEESSFFNVPCLTVRDNTERPITTTMGTNKLIGSNYKNILSELDIVNYNQNSNINLWDGSTASRIVQILKGIYKW
tara:strand:- start:5945 stop:7033 length:1089 start_codon:yes stop_codon:yes gene_type:complete